MKIFTVVITAILLCGCAAQKEVNKEVLKSESDSISVSKVNYTEEKKDSCAVVQIKSKEDSVVVSEDSASSEVFEETIKEIVLSDGTVVRDIFRKGNVTNTKKYTSLGSVHEKDSTANINISTDASKNNKESTVSTTVKKESKTYNKSVNNKSIWEAIAGLSMLVAGVIFSLWMYYLCKIKK